MSDGEEHSDPLFEEAMGDVEPLQGGARRLPLRRAPDPRRLGRGKAAGVPEAPRFHVEEVGGLDGDRVEGLAWGTDRARLARLVRGEVPVDMELDLHRLSESEARLAVEEAVRDAVERRLACLLVVHGRGRRSFGGAAVLKHALPEWLVELPLALHVLAFTTAPPNLGGQGATLLLLRRKRGKKKKEG